MKRARAISLLIGLAVSALLLQQARLARKAQPQPAVRNPAAGSKADGGSFRRVAPSARTSPTVSTLLRELDDSSPLTRESAAAELGGMGLPAYDALPELRRLAQEDPDENVRRACREALFNVRGCGQAPFFMVAPVSPE